MPRRSGVPKRLVAPDPKFNSILVTKIINQVMYDGKKGIAINIVYEALDIVQSKLNLDGLKILNQAIDNAMPILEIKPRRVGGANIQVPVEVRGERKRTLAVRWLILFSRKRKERTMQERLALEIIDTYNKIGTTIKRKEEVQKMAEANRAFAHYRW